MRIEESKDGRPDSGPDLEGRHILVVGGRKELVCHFRRLVENCNGCFACHDGGIEDNIRRLRKLFSRADMVMFPVDNVSHAAQDAVKDLCRRNEKPFMALRTSGVASFAKALAGVAEKQKPA